MHLLVTVVEEPEKIEPILDMLYENDITGATVIDSRGMGHMIADHYSIFSRFSNLTGSHEGETHNNVLFTVIRTEETLERAIEIIKEVIGDLNQPNTGLLFTMRLDRVEGFATPLKDE